MKQALKTTALLVAFAALSTSAFAQGRHDEKPHGMKAPSSATEESRASGTGGRHDEGSTSHGKKKPAAKKKKKEEEEAATDTAPAGK